MCCEIQIVSTQKFENYNKDIKENKLIGVLRTSSSLSEIKREVKKKEKHPRRAFPFQ